MEIDRESEMKEMLLEIKQNKASTCICQSVERKKLKKRISRTLKMSLKNLDTM